MISTTKSRKASRGRLPDGRANPIDAHVGARVRLRRTLLGMSQERLADALGLTFQQVQKYERGGNRISASRLYDLSRVLDVPVAFFFDDLTEDVQACSPAALAGGTAIAAPAEAGDNPLSRRAVLDLSRDIARLSDRQIQSVRKVIAAIADGQA